MAFDSTGIEFALVALFIVLTIEQIKALGDSFPLWAGAFAAGISMVLVGPSHQLILAIAIVTGILLIQYRQLKNRLPAAEASHD